MWPPIWHQNTSITGQNLAMLTVRVMSVATAEKTWPRIRLAIRIHNKEPSISAPIASSRRFLQRTGGRFQGFLSAATLVGLRTKASASVYGATSPRPPSSGCAHFPPLCSPQTPSLPGADPRHDGFRFDGRKSNFMAERLKRAFTAGLIFALAFSFCREGAGSGIFTY